MWRKKKKPHYSSNRQILFYAGLGTRLLVSIGGSVYVGLKADQRFNTSTLFVVILPLLVLGAIFYKLIKETKS